MSATVDNRIVSMEFDNKQFESAVKESRATLNHLSETLDKLEGNSKSFKTIEDAAKKVDFSTMEQSLETITEKLSNMGTIGYMAMKKIKDAAIDAGVDLAKSLTIDQVSAGYSKYEDKVAAVQTIMAATGASIDTVNQNLKQLQWYSDETSYDFVDMTSNIAKFTSAGQALEDSTVVIQGISSAIALAGGNAQTATRVMYNLSQAMGMGAVTLTDWRSIELANAATVSFKEQIIKSALEVGTLTKAADGTVQTMKGTVVTAETLRDTLNEDWFTNAVLMKVGETYGEFGSELEHFYELTGLTASQSLQLLKEYETGAKSLDEIANDLKISDKILEKEFSTLLSEENQLGRQAFEAAQVAKTFTDAVNATKDAVSSQFLETFETIFGAYDTAKVFWTDVSNSLWDIFAGPIEAINETLGEGLDTNWEKMSQLIAGCDVKVDDFKETLAGLAGMSLEDINKQFDDFGSFLATREDRVELVTNALRQMSGQIGVVQSAEEKLAEVSKTVNEVIRGEWGNGEERIQRLNEANWDAAYIQNLVDRVWMGGKVTLADLNEEMLKSAGCTEEQAAALLELAEQAEAAGTDINDLLLNMDKISGREHLMAGLLNVLELIANVMGVVSEAWSAAFDEISGDVIYDIVEGFHEFTETALENSIVFDTLRNTLTAFFIIASKVISVIKTFTSIGMEVISAFLKPAINFVNALSESIVEMLNSMDESRLYVSVINYANRIKSAFIGIANTLEKIDFKGSFDTARSALNNLLHTTTVLTPQFESVSNAIKNVFNSMSPDKIIDGSFAKSLKQLATAFSNLRRSIKNGGLTISLAQVKDAFTKFFEEIAGTDVGKFLATPLNALKEVITKTNWDEVFAAAFEAIKECLGTVKDLLAVVWDSLSKELDEEFSKIVEGIEEFANNAPKSFEELIDRISKKIQELKDLFSKEFPETYSVLSEFISELKAKVKEFFGINEDTTTGLSDFLLAWAQGIGKVFPTIGGILATIITAVSDFYTEFKTVTSGNDLTGIVQNFTKSLLGVVLGFTVIKRAIKTIQNGGKLTDLIPNFVSTVEATLKAAKGVFSSMSTFLKQWGGVALTKSFQNVAKSMLYLAGAVILLVAAMGLISALPQENLWKAFAMVELLVITLGAIVVLIAGLSTLSTAKDSLKIGSLAGGLIAFVVSLYGIIFAIMILANMDLGAFVGGLVALAFVAAFLLGFYAAAGKISSTLEKIKGVKIKVSGIFGIAAAIALLAGTVMAIAALSKYVTIDQMENALLIVIAMSLFLAIVGAALGAYNVNGRAALGAMGIAAAISALSFTVIAIAYLSKLTTAAEMQAAMKIVLAVSAIIVVLSGVLTGTSMDLKTATAALAVAAAVTLLAVALAALSMLPIDIGRIFAIAGAVAVLLVALGLMGKLGGKNLQSVGKTMLMIAGSALIFAAALYVAAMAASDFGDGIWTAVGALGILLVLFVGAAAIMTALPGASSSLLAIGGAMLMIAGSALIFAAAIYVAGYAFDKFGNGIWMAVGAIAALAVVFAIIIGVLSALPVATITLAVLAAAMLVAAAGAFLFAAALVYMGENMPAIITGLLGFVAALKAANDMISGAEVLSVMLKMVGLGLSVVVMLSLVSIGILALAVACAVLAVALLALGIGAALPTLEFLLIAAAATILALALDAVAPSLSDVASGLVQLGASVAILSTMGLASMAGDIAKFALSLLLLTVVESIANMFKSGSYDIVDAIKELASSFTEIDLTGTIGDFADGLLGASEDASGKAKEAGKTLVESTAEGVEEGASETGGLKSMIMSKLFGDSEGIDWKSYIFGEDGLSSSGLTESLEGMFEGVNIDGSSFFSGMSVDTSTMDWSSIIGDVDLETITNSLGGSFEGQSFDLNSFLGLSGGTTIDTTTFTETLGATLTESFSASATTGAEGATESYQSAGETNIDTYIEGMNSKTGDVEAAAKTVSDAGAEAIKQGDYEGSGYYVDQGFANGITNNAYLPVNAATSVAQQTLAALNAASGVASPSKLYAKSGAYCAEGLAIGMQSRSGMIENAARQMSHTAFNAVTDLAYMVNDAMNSDLSPVITPVVDMSNVQEQASNISSLFGGTQTVGLTSSILSGSGIIQNGSATQEAVQSAVALDSNTLAALAKSNSTGPQNIKINFNGSLAQLARILQPEIVAETTRRGPSLVNE